MTMKRRWITGMALLAVLAAGVVLMPGAGLLANPDDDGEARGTVQVMPTEDQADGEESPTAYIQAANDELLKLKDLEEGSQEYDDIILQAYKIVGHGFHKYPRDPSLTVLYAAMKPVQLFRHFGWRIQGFLIHSPMDYRRYKNTVRRSYEQWRITGNRAGTHWIRWFTDVPEDAAFDVQEGKFANSAEFALFPDGEKLQTWLAEEAFPELENVTRALEKNVVARNEDFAFNWDLRSGFSNWALGGGTVLADESPVKRIGRSEGLVLASAYRSWIGWAKIFCSYNFNSFFKVRSRFNQGKAFTELAELVKQFTLPDLFKIWDRNDEKGVLDGKAFIKSSQADLLASLAILDELNSNQFSQGDSDPAGRWFDYNVMMPWSGRIANLLNEMRALLSGPVSLEDSWNKTRTTVNLAGQFDNPPTDLTLFLPTKIQGPEKTNRYMPFFKRFSVRKHLNSDFDIDLRHLIKPKQNVDLLDLNMRVDWQPTHDPAEWKDYTMNGLFPDAKDRDGLLRGLYTMVNSRSGPLSSGGVWSLVYGTLFWTN